MPDLVLYHAWVSSASRKVRLCLAEKGVAYASHPMDLATFEHHAEWYKALNPSGIVPALVAAWFGERAALPVRRRAALVRRRSGERRAGGAGVLCYLGPRDAARRPGSRPGAGGFR